MWWCLHGALGSFRDWSSLDLPEHCAVDLWATPRAETMSRWASQWTSAVAERDSAPYLLGYSMGGRLALHALLAAPGLWKGAVIVSAHPGLHRKKERLQRQATDAAWLARFRCEEVSEVMRDWDGQAVFAGPNRVRAPENFEPSMARCFQEWSLGRQEPLWDRLGEIAVPLWWLCGERDPKFVALGREAVASLPDAQFVEAPSCGHRVPWEWQGFSRLLNRIPAG